MIDQNQKRQEYSTCCILDVAFLLLLLLLFFLLIIIRFRFVSLAGDAHADADVETKT